MNNLRGDKKLDDFIISLYPNVTNIMTEIGAQRVHSNEQDIALSHVAFSYDH